ncbi:transcriptional antiterminator, BglG family [Paenibacillus sophorae]|uniref:PRD domain-containing protein n=1 Tax=Paenibacillus sophorae TaxID=1333845 RepID=A0A1H8TZC2_9BACL|nr:PRD domain-containing protein [Paenibacillus sophorae]QWU13111.1 PRD domain-containing protein [Paenibacillus sophorae]SEO96166.1 transcriptional antiterminator, BglG family [Paenibacillus sophorae]
MKIEGILNNNAVISTKEKQEVIIIGRGIGFKKRVGDDINEQQIHKIFTLENEDTMKKFKTLIADMPMEYMDISEKIIAYAKIKLGKKLNDSIYIHLTDHIYFAIERYKNNLPIKNGLLWEIRQIYKDEHEIGLEALNMICEKFGVLLPEDEAGFLALHIVNAELNEEMPVVKNMTKVMQEVLTIVRYHFKLDFNENSLSFYRFITHLKFFAHRLVKSNHYKSTSDDDLYNVIKVKYPDAYECSKKIKKFIESSYTYELTDEEMIYLTIHIERVFKNNNE